ncbi:MAG: PLP-dependent aminotransferase family protein [Gemmatimonadetes bacterium]|nr:PLP-dependent aminotransferase family protein [Gemmatimonadota bacterium]
MRRADGAIPPIALQPDAGAPLYLQLSEGLRQAIVSGYICGGTRLPSTRGLARDMDVSRTTAIQAYRQLELEGYVVSAVGSGTYVTDELPDRIVSVAVPAPSSNGHPDHERSLSDRGRRMVDRFPDIEHRHGVMPLLPAVPALDKFPYKMWRRIEHEVHVPTSELGPGDAAGHLRLRRAIVEHVAVTRAIRCDVDQVVITTGAQEAFSILAELLFDPGDSVLIEEPGHRGGASAFEAFGAEVVPVRVDADGMDVDAGISLHPDARLACVTPSNQFPMGALLNMRRRIGLVEWARAAGSWIIEDDYDCEYRFHGAPYPAIRSLEGADVCTVYVNAFTKILFPALSLGFVILPDALVEPFKTARALRDYPPPPVPQLALAKFMEEGHLMRHIRRMRQVYEVREAALRDALHETLPTLLEVAPATAGTHLVAWLPRGVDDQEVSARAAGEGVFALPISQFRHQCADRGGLVLGFGGSPVPRLGASVRRLARAFG